MPSEDTPDQKRWRKERFLDLGLEEPVVSLLVDWQSDTHEVEKLVKAGCEPALLVDIMRPV